MTHTTTFNSTKLQGRELIEGTITSFREANTDARQVLSNYNVDVLAQMWLLCMKPVSSGQHNSLTPNSILESISFVSQLYLLCTAELSNPRE